MPDKPKASPSLYEYFLSEYNKPFEGWDFAYIEGKRKIKHLPWNYRAKVESEIRNAAVMLDMGTGGGEFLAGLPLPKFTYATEAYQPNNQIATERLTPLGVKVIGIDSDDNLPFNDEFFDLIINRHGSYSAQEVFRILKPGGCFITQQAGGTNDIELNKLLGANETVGFDHWDLDFAIEQLLDAGLEITEKYEAYPITKYYDTGAILYYLKAVPWQIPDFSVDKYYDALVNINDTINENGFIEIRSHRFFIKSFKAFS